MITRLEWGLQGGNPRFIVTNLDGDAQALYDELYCLRGEAENRIKEAQVGLFATRTSCHVMRIIQLQAQSAFAIRGSDASVCRRAAPQTGTYTRALVLKDSLSDIVDPRLDDVGRAARSNSLW